MAVDYGLDISCTTDIDPLLGLVTGEEMMAQVCIRRLYCRKGSLLSDPTDNTLDARDFVSGGIANSAALLSIQGQCQGALLADERVLSVSVVAEYDTVFRVLTLRIAGQGADGPFSLVLSVDSVTVQLLEPL